MDYFPRGEISSAELGTFEIASENGIYSEGDLNSAGVASTALVGAPFANGVLASAGIATLTLPADSPTLREGALAIAGISTATLEGVAFQPGLLLGADPMYRGTEQRDMTRPAEYLQMAVPVSLEIERDEEQRGITA